MQTLAKKLLAAGSALALGLAAIGCGGSGGGSEGAGTLAVRLADAPDPSVTAVNVTIDRVEAHVNGTWQPIAANPQTFNLLELAENDTLLGTTSLPSGHYTQVRLFVSEATITDADGTHDVTIPSAAQTGIKVLVNYDINEGDTTTLLLDFDVAHSFNKTGSGTYMLKPVIRGVVKVLTGTITGTVTDANGPVQGAVVKATPAGGTPAETDPATLTQADGTFKLWGVSPGTYVINVTHSPEGGTTQTGTKADLTVTANANTDAGTISISAPAP